jgi:hypothetical protein
MKRMREKAKLRGQVHEEERNRRKSAMKGKENY